MTHKKIIVGGLVGLGIIGLIAGILYMKSSGGDGTDQGTYNQEVSAADPVDIALDFYSPWLEAAKSTSTNPYTLGLASEKILSEQLRVRLIGSESRAETDIDPVLCQTTFPERVNGRVVSAQEREVRVLIVAKEKTLTAQSVFVLKKQNDGWYIEDILCSPGEFELPREFSFEKEGHLLKSVPPPLNPEYWHLVSEENGEPGHAVPLFFTTESSCVAMDTTVEVCAPDAFRDATKVHVYGQMTERGVEVARLQFLE